MTAQRTRRSDGPDAIIRSLVYGDRKTRAALIERRRRRQDRNTRIHYEGLLAEMRVMQGELRIVRRLARRPCRELDETFVAPLRSVRIDADTTLDEPSPVTHDIGDFT